MTPLDLSEAQRRHLLAMLDHGATPTLYRQWSDWVAATPVAELGAGIAVWPGQRCSCGAKRGAWTESRDFRAHGTPISSSSLRALGRRGLVTEERSVHLGRLWGTAWVLTEAGELLARLMDAMGLAVRDVTWPRVS